MQFYVHLCLRYLLFLAFVALFVRFSQAEVDNLLLQAMGDPELNIGHIQQLLEDGHNPNVKNGVGWVCPRYSENLKSINPHYRL